MTFELTSLFTADARNSRPSEIRRFARMINDPAIISFAGGVPSPLTFPVELVAGIAQQVILGARQVSLQYGPTRGLPRLRELLCEVTRQRGIACDMDNMLITSGSQQALSLLSHVLLEPGDVVVVELPTYIGANASFLARRAELVGVQQDDEGVVPASLAETLDRLAGEGRRVKFFYTIPNFQNPSGRVMSTSRRTEVARIAAERGVLIVEDDPYGELVYQEGIDTTPIAANPGGATVIYLSSMSKVLSPGLRCGWMLAPEPLATMIEVVKESVDLCSGMLDQSIVEKILEAGELAPQIERVRDFYRDRRAVLLAAMAEHFPAGARWTEAVGGLFTWVTLADDVDTEKLLPAALEAGVAFVPGRPFFVDGSGRSTMRLTFAKEPDDRLREGVVRLARVIS